jgi:dihydroxyacetone kinase-like predicted kinase
VLDLTPDERPTLGRLLSAVRELSDDQTVLLPNSREWREVADQVASELRGIGGTVTVIPTRSVLQGLAAVAVHDAGRRYDDDVVAMTGAAAATRYGEVTRAATDAFTSAGPCRAGDVLGLIDDDVAVIGDDVADVARGLLDRLLISGGELVTVVSGVETRNGLADELADYVTATRPAVEVVRYVAAVPGNGVLVGVE